MRKLQKGIHPLTGERMEVAIDESGQPATGMLGVTGTYANLPSARQSEKERKLSKGSLAEAGRGEEEESKHRRKSKPTVGASTQQKMHERLLRIRAKERKAAEATADSNGKRQREDVVASTAERPMKARKLTVNEHGGTHETGGASSSGCMQVEETAAHESGRKRAADGTMHGEMQRAAVRRRISTKRPG